MFMLGLSENHRLAGYGSVHWYGYALRDDGHVLRSAIDFEVESQRKGGRR